MGFSKKQIFSLKSELKALELQLKRDIEQAKDSTKPVKLDQQAVGRLSRIDAIQQQQIQSANLQRMEQRLSMVLATFRKLDRDDFGLCKVCEEPISFDRLKARPESALCLNCAKQKK